MKLHRSSTAGFARADLVMIIAIVMLIASLAVAGNERLQTTARIALCQKNLREIGRAVQQFARDHNGRLPGTLLSDAGDPWWWYKEQVKGYLGLTAPSSEEDRAFACPMDRGYSDPGPFAKNPRFNYSSYVFNGVTLPGVPNIAGWELAAVTEPNRTLSVMEWCAHAPLSWHRSRTGKANRPFYSDAESLVAFVDGHAEMVKIYYDGYNAAYTRDPIPGYRYRYSGR
jgi:hypothetical protein